MESLQGKMGNGLKVASFFFMSNRIKVTPLFYKSSLPAAATIFKVLETHATFCQRHPNNNSGKSLTNSCSQGGDQWHPTWGLLYAFGDIL